jgi:hypothetical protein
MRDNRSQFCWLEQGQEQKVTPIGGRGLWFLPPLDSITIGILYILHVCVAPLFARHPTARLSRLSDRLCEWVNSDGKFAAGPSNDAILKVDLCTAICMLFYMPEYLFGLCAFC